VKPTVNLNVKSYSTRISINLKFEVLVKNFIEMSGVSFSMFCCDFQHVASTALSYLKSFVWFDHCCYMT
jgi:hypothetical protein